MTFRFLPDTHEYFLDDRRLESVTEIIEAAGMIGTRHFTEESRIRGTYVHRASEMVDRGTLDWTDLDPVLLPYCRAYQAFIEDKRPEILLSEKPLYHATHLFAGTLDRLVRMDGGISLIDIKSGVPSPATAIQVAAYRELVKVNEDIINGLFIPTKCYSLHLRDDGTYRLAECGDHRRNFNIFMAALTITRWKREAA